MMTGEQILARLEDARVRKSDIAKTLGLPDSRVAEMYGGRRLLKLDEAVKLVETYQLEETRDEITPLPLPIARLLVLHVAQAVGHKLSAEDPLVSELAADLRAFALFAADRRVRDSVQAAEGFLRGMQTRRTGAAASQPSKRPRHGR
jgi:hypothetical protein